MSSDAQTPARAPRVLLLTSHLRVWAGSELVIIELAEELLRRGCSVRLYSDIVDQAFIAPLLEKGATLATEVGDVALTDFDVVYCQHHMLTAFTEQLLGRDRGRLPFIIYGHLSPYDALEMPGPAIEPIHADLILCNSEETRARMRSLGLPDHRMEVLPNPAPEGFFALRPGGTALRRLLAVSNHFPKEVVGALDLLRQEGVEVTVLGRRFESRRVTPRDLEEHDAVVTIGKTVQYALASGRPAFVYDRFGGPGWLLPANLEACARHNFSGRCCATAKSADEIAREIRDGFGSARAFAEELRRDADRWRLSRYVERLFLAGRPAARHDADPFESLGEDRLALIRREHLMFVALRQARLGAARLKGEALRNRADGSRASARKPAGGAGRIAGWLSRHFRRR